MARHCPDRISRRQFLARTAAVAASGAAVTAGGAEKATPGEDVEKLASTIPTRTAPPASASVVVVTDRRVLDADGKTNGDVLAAMLDKAVVTLSGAASPAEAWRKYFRKGDLVALKYNELGGPAIATDPKLRESVINSLTRHVEIATDKIVPIGRCTQYKGKYKGWGKAARIHTCGFDTQFSDVFDKHATAILCLPVCKTHQSVGVTCAMKLHLGSVKNPFMFCGDDDWPRLWKDVPELNSQPTLRKKTRLIVVDALRPQYNQGPTHNPRFRFRHCSLIATTDPVACDATALGIIEAARKRKMKDWQLPWAHKTLAFAQALGVGLCDEKKIKLTRIDMTPGGAKEA